MKKLLIIHTLTLFFITSPFLSESNFVFAQQDSNSIVIEIKSSQDTTQSESDEKEKTSLNITDEVGINSIKDLFKFEKIIASLIVLLVGFYLLKIVTKILQYFAERRASYRISYKGTIPIVRLLGW